MSQEDTKKFKCLNTLEFSMLFSLLYVFLGTPPPLIKFNREGCQFFLKSSCYTPPCTVYSLFLLYNTLLNLFLESVAGLVTIMTFAGGWSSSSNLIFCR